MDDAELRDLLRTAVAVHGRSEPRRVYAPLLHAGRPGGPEVVFGHRREDGRLDHALRTDVVEEMLRRTDHVPGRLLWLTRPGGLDLHELDHAWLAASLAAAGETGTAHRFAVVTRHGWRDPRSGEERRWRRLRTDR